MADRHASRVAARRQANAEECNVPLTEWLALSRTERKRRLAAARSAS